MELAEDQDIAAYPLPSEPLNRESDLFGARDEHIEHKPRFWGNFQDGTM